MASENKSSLDALSSLAKRRGFIYHSSEIYGGMPGFWDYGPLGCELKRNVKDAWWQFTVRGREDVAGVGGVQRLVVARQVAAGDVEAGQGIYDRGGIHV